MACLYHMLMLLIPLVRYCCCCTVVTVYHTNIIIIILHSSLKHTHTHIHTRTHYRNKNHHTYFTMQGVIAADWLVKMICGGVEIRTIYAGQRQAKVISHTLNAYVILPLLSHASTSSFIIFKYSF